MSANEKTPSKPHRRRRGFERASTLLRGRVRAASEKRGFAETRLLTHWPEVVGAEIAAICRPVSVGYSRGGMGATLTVLTTGAQAPMLQMQEHKLREKINAVYGYAAISRLRFTQTAPTGFAEGQAQFGPAPVAQPAAPDIDTCREAMAIAAGAEDEGLRHVLEKLGAAVLTRSKKTKSE